MNAHLPDEVNQKTHKGVDQENKRNGCDNPRSIPIQEAKTKENDGSTSNGDYKKSVTRGTFGKIKRAYIIIAEQIKSSCKGGKGVKENRYAHNPTESSSH